MAKNGKRKAFSADARSNDSFSGCGGESDPTNGMKVKVGGVATGGGSDKHHGAAKSQANVNPPSADKYASFSGVGGKAKTSN
jgi:hypothetical protein